MEAPKRKELIQAVFYLGVAIIFSGVFVASCFLLAQAVAKLLLRLLLVY